MIVGADFKKDSSVAGVSIKICFNVFFSAVNHCVLLPQNDKFPSQCHSEKANNIAYQLPRKLVADEESLFTEHRTLTPGTY
jgi:hypothetical protein